MKKHLFPLFLLVLLALGCKKEPDACFFYAGEDLSIQFNADCSVNADSYHWDFGDGTTSVGASIRHFFPAFGTYTVELTVETKRGKTSTTSTDITLKPAPNLVFDGVYALNETCNGASNTYTTVIGPNLGTRNEFTINGIQGNGDGVTAVINGSGTAFTIARQPIGVTYELESTDGSFNADASQITMTYMLYNVTSGNLELTCTALFTR